MENAFVEDKQVLALGRDIMVTISCLQFPSLVHPWERSENVMMKTGSVTQQVRDAFGLGPRTLCDDNVLQGLTSFERFTPSQGPAPPSDEDKQKERLCGCLAFSSSFSSWRKRVGGLWGE